ncbi:protein transporter tim9 [Arthrobotrys megalospora]
MDGLTPSEQREFQSVVERRQMREFMQMYSNLVQRCFDDCVNDFTSKTMTTKEEGCISKCVEKWLKGSERMGQRFAEQNAAMMQSGGSLGGGASR